jgi:hypothetical protein
MANEPKRETYVSLNRNETSLLDQLPFEERWLYVKLKWLANFKTGKIGKFGRRVLTYEKIGEMIGVPSAQGRPAQPVSGGEVKRMIDRLETAGLVTDHSYHAKSGIALTLPLSPIRPVGAQGKLQTDTPTQSPAKARGTTLCDERQPPQSVLMSSGHNNTFFSNDGAGDTPAPRRPPGGPPPPPSPKGEDKTDSAGAAPLTVAGIRELFEDCWIEFHYLDTAETRRFFDNWIKRGVTVEELQQAIEEVAAGKETPTAGAVERWISFRRQGDVAKRAPRAGRGRVAL